MLNIPETTLNILLGGLLGAIGGLFSIPINAYVLWKLKRDELFDQHKLNLIEKERELLLKHKLEFNAKERELFLQYRLDSKRQEPLSKEISNLQNRILTLENELARLTQGKNS